MTTESLDDLIRALVTNEPPRWDKAARELEGLRCADELRERLSEFISRRAPLEELWPTLDELAAPPTGTTIDWAPPPIGDEMIREFFSEVDGFLVDLGPLLVDASDETPEILDEIHRRLHTIKGNSGIVGLTPLMRVVHVMEDLVKGIQAGDPPMDDSARAILIEGIGIATDITRVAREGSGEPVAWTEYREGLLARMEGDQGSAHPPAVVATASPSGGPLPESTPVSADAGTVSLPRGGDPAQPERGVRRTPPPTQQITADATRTLRVDFARLDSLVNLVGEQVTTENRLARVIQQFRERLDELRPCADGAPIQEDDLPSLSLDDGEAWTLEDFYEALEQAAADLDLTSGKLQSSVLGMRMVPIGRLFNRHKASVFQVANALSKKVRLVIEGGEAELDKRLVEQLEDPLLHLVRNAVSHGVDSPDLRRKQGKPEDGTVTLRAFPEGNLMVIEVQDDGVGIDHEVLKRKAVEKGFLHQEEAAALDPRESMELIFAPGFSTTGTVDDISGRGVGLDVVQERITRLGGAVTVDSRPGEGTTFRLTVPLTLALTRVLLVEAGGELVAIPVATVRQVHHLQEIAVVDVGGRTMASVGEETLPYIDLGPFLGLTDLASSEPRSVVLVRVVYGDRLALFRVDRVFTQQQVVVKDMGALLAHVPHSMGATIADDRCVLIVDSASVVREWGRGSEWLIRREESGGQDVPDARRETDSTVSAISVAVLGDPDQPTGLEDMPIFRVLRASTSDQVPADAAAVMVIVDDMADLEERVGAVRLVVGSTIPVIALTSGAVPPAAAETFDAGADDAWGATLSAEERVDRLERVLALYSHLGNSSSAVEDA